MRQREKSHGDTGTPEKGANELFGTHLHRTMAHSRVQMWSLSRTAGHVLPHSAKEITMAVVGRVGVKGLVQSLAERSFLLKEGHIF